MAQSVEDESAQVEQGELDDVVLCSVCLSRDRARRCIKTATSAVKIFRFFATIPSSRNKGKPLGQSDVFETNHVPMSSFVPAQFLSGQVDSLSFLSLPPPPPKEHNNKLFHMLEPAISND